jgi:hypothetical protein
MKDAVSREEMRIQVISSHTAPVIPALTEDGCSARAMVWPGMGAGSRSMHLIRLSAGRRTRAMRHDSEAVYYVIRGSITARDHDLSERHDASEGGFIFVEPETEYILASDREPAVIVGGPCPPDPSLYLGMVLPRAGAARCQTLDGDIEIGN